ncbi:hypothetical protein ACHAXT_004384 [Thalassiosira profunda]
MIRLISISAILTIGCVGGFGPITLGHQSLQLHASGDTALIEAISSDERNRIDDMIRERSEARWRGDFAAADALRDSIDNIRVKLPSTRVLQHINVTDAISNWDIDVEYKVAVTDVPRSEGGGSEWELIPIGSPVLDGDGQNEDNILQLAHAALGLAVSASEQDVDIDQSVLNELIGRAEDRLSTLKERKAICNIFLNSAAAAGELHGRKAADAILWFALAGVTAKHANLYSDLVDICTDELQRFGRNASCRAKDVLHIAERVAMAGVVGDSAKRLYEVTADCLEVKMQEVDACSDSNGEEGGDIDYRNIIEALRDGSFCLHSDRPLLGLWRFSTRQRKQRSFLRNAARHFDGKFGDDRTEMNLAPPKQNQYDWPAMFTDPSRPLVVDVGCGFGVSTLGLASVGNSKVRPGANEIQIDRDNCNYIGVDLSRVAIGYARGVSERLALGDLTFVVDSAEKCLGRIQEGYPGKVVLIMVQFPTPYRFEGVEEAGDTDSSSSVAKGYNSQLPEGAASDSFMVTENLLSLAHDILAKDNGQLLIQSNCEDVAVHMKNTAVNVGLNPALRRKELRDGRRSAASEPLGNIGAQSRCCHR